MAILGTLIDLLISTANDLVQENASLKAQIASVTNQDQIDKAALTDAQSKLGDANDAVGKLTAALQSMGVTIPQNGGDGTALGNSSTAPAATTTAASS